MPYDAAEQTTNFKTIQSANASAVGAPQCPTVFCADARTNCPALYSALFETIPAAIWKTFEATDMHPIAVSVDSTQWDSVEATILGTDIATFLSAYFTTKLTAF